MCWRQLQQKFINKDIFQIKRAALNLADPGNNIIIIGLKSIVKVVYIINNPKLLYLLIALSKGNKFK